MSERKTFFADVLLPVPIHQVFTYRVPFELNDSLAFGLRVIVPFGKSKLVNGIVRSVIDHLDSRARDHVGRKKDVSNR